MRNITCSSIYAICIHMCMLYCMFYIWMRWIALYSDVSLNKYIVYCEWVGVEHANAHINIFFLSYIIWHQNENIFFVFILRYSVFLLPLYIHCFVMYFDNGWMTLMFISCGSSAAVLPVGLPIYLLHPIK